MPIDFPIPSYIGELFTAGGKTWMWNGYGWDAVTPTAVGATGATGPGIGATGATGVLPPSNFGNTWGYTGDGTQTVFGITGGASILPQAYLVHIDGIYQKPSNYTIDNVTPRTLTFSQAVPSESEITIVSLSIA